LGRFYSPFIRVFKPNDTIGATRHDGSVMMRMAVPGLSARFGNRPALTVPMIRSLYGTISSGPFEIGGLDRISIRTGNVRCGKQQSG
jgi:hypothetical protein